MRALFPLALAGLMQLPASGADLAPGQVTGDPEVVRQQMAAFGLPVERGNGAGGTPMLESRIDGTAFTVYFHDCRPVCTAIQFSAGFDLDEPLPIELVNLWNRDRRFGRAFLDEAGDPFVQMDIGLAGDGIGSQNFKDALETWRIVLSEFREFIDW